MKVNLNLKYNMVSGHKHIVANYTSKLKMSSLKL